MQKRGTSIDPASLPAINEFTSDRCALEAVMPELDCYSPTRLIKESLRLHGHLNRDLENSLNGGKNAYEDFCESNYRTNLRKAAYYGDYNEASSRSHSYSKKMRRIKERSERHGDADDLDKLYSSDVSALKKLQMTENNHDKLGR